MIADISITEKSFGPKTLMTNVKFSVGDREKIGLIGRNGVGKSTLFGILTGADKDYSGGVIFHRGVSVVATAQEHHGVNSNATVLDYILQGLPEYAELHRILRTYPETMGDDMKKIAEYTAALDRFGQKGFYNVEEVVQEELKNFQLGDKADTSFGSLSGGQKRLAEIVKIMHSDADLALIDEPTNHMDYVAKDQFISWMKTAPEAMIVITHDRDVLNGVDRIVELKDGGSVCYRGDYDAYLKQNASTTGVQMNDFEMVEKRIINLKQKVIDYQRLKEKSRNPLTVQKFKRLENSARAELTELQEKEKPTFWIDRDSVENLSYKVAGQYDKFKARNIRIKLSKDESRSKHVLVSAKNLSLGYTQPLFEGVNVDLREGEVVELRGRNGAGKTTLIRALIDKDTSETKIFNGEIELDKHVRIGVYEQEASGDYFPLKLEAAIERLYLDRGQSVSNTKIRSLMSDYLFTESDARTPLERLSGGQKARFQLIAMLANDPQLLILDEPTNHLDLPSIEELETALEKYSGAILYISHDGYFRKAIGGEVVRIGKI